MKYEFCARTDPGLVRANNEDAVSVDAQAYIAVLADGMGGYNAGEVASRMATTLVHTEMARWLAQAPPPIAPHDVHQALEACVIRANQAIYDSAQSDAQCSGMGTTLVAGVFCGAQLILAHVGDSRAYRLRAGELTQITRDHSWLQEQIDAGWLTPQQAALSGGRNLVTRALGAESTVAVEINEFQIAPEDLILLCSDGLSEMLTPDDITALASGTASLEDKASALIAAANANGGRDNISVLLVQALPQELPAAQRKRSCLSRWLSPP